MIFLISCIITMCMKGSINHILNIHINMNMIVRNRIRNSSRIDIHINVGIFICINIYDKIKLRDQNHLNANAISLLFRNGNGLCFV